MHNEIICVIKIRANILQLVQLIKSFHLDGITWKKWAELDAFTRRSLREDVCRIVVNNAMSAWTEYGNDCGSAAQCFNCHTWVVILSFAHQPVCLQLHTLHTMATIIQDCIILFLFSSYETQTALNRQPYGELSMPAVNNRLSAILLKLNPAQIPHQKH